MSTIEDLQTVVGHLSDKVDSIIDHIYEMIDMIYDDNDGQNIYTMQHQKLMKFLDDKFYNFEQKFNALLRAPKFSKNLAVYDIASDDDDKILYEIIEDNEADVLRRDGEMSALTFQSGVRLKQRVYAEEGC